ncbi:MAG TPA: hypothetical protein VFU43_00115 [Streptosporangiaceae bacterium]|nr:hypothetical protein [Streptosporangiaceae bacterium]
MGKHGTGGNEQDGSKDKDKQGTFVDPTKGGRAVQFHQARQIHHKLA